MVLVSYGPIGIRTNTPMYVLTTHISNVLNARTHVGLLTIGMGTDS